MGTTGASTHQQTSSLQPPRNSKRDPAPATAGGRHRCSSNPRRHSTSGTDQETGMALHEPWCCQRRVRSKNCASGQHRLWWQATGGPNQGCPELSVRNKWEFFRYQIFSIPIPILFFRTKFFRYRFRDFFRYQNFPLTIPIPPEKNEKFPVPVPIINLQNSKILATKFWLEINLGLVKMTVVKKLGHFRYR